MGRFQTVPIKRLRGLNEDEDPNSVAEDELVVANNTYSRGETKGTRPGTERDPDSYTSAVTGAPPIQGLFELRRNNDSLRTLVAVAGTGIYTGPSTVITGAVSITSGSANAWTFAEHKNTLYAAGGTGTDSFWKWTGTGNAAVVSMLDLSAGAIYPTYVFEKWNRLFTAGFRDAAGGIASDNSSNPMVVRYSALNDGDTWPVGASFGGSSAIGGFSAYGGEFVTGFADYTDNNGDWLLILTNRRIYSAMETGDPLAPFYISKRGAIANGCVHQRAFVNLGLDSGDAVYLSSEGIHSLAQSQEHGALQRSFLSWKIRKTFNTINQAAIQNSVSAYDRKNGLVLFAVPTGSSTIPNLILSLNIKGKDALTAENAEWDIWYRGGENANAKATTAMTSARDSGDDWYIYAGNAVGDVFRFNSSVASDLSYAYQVSLRTKHSDYGIPGVTKGPGDIYLTMQPGASYSPSFRVVYDYGQRFSSLNLIDLTPVGGSVFGTAVFGTARFSAVNATRRHKVYGSGSGVTLGFEVSHGAANEPFYVVGISPQIRACGEDIGKES